MKKIIAVLFFSIVLWHCKKNNSPTGTDGETRRPNLIVTSMSASHSNLAPSEMLTLTATVRNTGAEASTATTLRWYRSTDSTIDTADTPIGTNAVSILVAGANLTISNTITVPDIPGTYYYGACVDLVMSETETNDNCSSAVAIVVSEPSSNPELVVTSMSASHTNIAPSEMLTLTATIRNTGTRSSPATTLRWYRSTDSTITTNDTEVASNAVSTLAGEATLTISNTITVPSTTNTYYYGACVDPVTDESDPSNNCSSAVAVVVAVPPPSPELVVTNMGASSALVAPSGMLTLTATVWNTGGALPHDHPALVSLHQWRHRYKRHARSNQCRRYPSGWGDYPDF